MHVIFDLGKVPGSKLEHTGNITIPNLSDENSGEDVDVCDVWNTAWEYFINYGNNSWIVCFSILELGKWKSCFICSYLGLFQWL